MAKSALTKKHSEQVRAAAALNTPEKYTSTREREIYQRAFIKGAEWAMAGPLAPAITPPASTRRDRVNIASAITELRNMLLSNLREAWQQYALTPDEMSTAIVSLLSECLCLDATVSCDSVRGKVATACTELRRTVGNNIKKAAFFQRREEQLKQKQLQKAKDER